MAARRTQAEEQEERAERHVFESADYEQYTFTGVPAQRFEGTAEELAVEMASSSDLSYEEALELVLSQQLATPFDNEAAEE